MKIYQFTAAERHWEGQLFVVAENEAAAYITAQKREPQADVVLDEVHEIAEGVTFCVTTEQAF